MMGGAGGSLGRCIEQTHQDEALHKVIFVAKIRSELGNCMVRMLLRTDPRSLYDHVHLKGSCKEKRLVVELNALKEALNDGQLSILE